jgi:hypothetical protein
MAASEAAEAGLGRHPSPLRLSCLSGRVEVPVDAGRATVNMPTDARAVDGRCFFFLLLLLFASAGGMDASNGACGLGRGIALVGRGLAVEGRGLAEEARSRPGEAAAAGVEARWTAEGRHDDAARRGGWARSNESAGLQLCCMAGCSRERAVLGRCGGGGLLGCGWLGSWLVFSGGMAELGRALAAEGEPARAREGVIKYADEETANSEPPPDRTKSRGVQMLN